MGRYFTKTDREAVISLEAVAGRLGQVIEEWAAHDRPKEWLKDLRMSRSFLIRANESIKDQCADEDFQRVAKLYRGCSLTLIPREEYKKFTESAAVAHIPLDAWGNLAESYIETNCKCCKIGNTPDHENCRARKTMMMAGIPSMDDPVPETQCQYFWFREQAAAAAPDHWDTGIKIKDGHPLYKCRIYCKNPDCGHKGNVYVSEGRKSVKCYQCGFYHKVRPAHTEGFPNRDEWGNFTIADELQKEEKLNV